MIFVTVLHHPVTFFMGSKRDDGEQTFYSCSCAVARTSRASFCSLSVKETHESSCFHDTNLPDRCGNRGIHMCPGGAVMPAGMWSDVRGGKGPLGNTRKRLSEEDKPV